jgi:hypothetical protein
MLCLVGCQVVSNEHDSKTIEDPTIKNVTIGTTH